MIKDSGSRTRYKNGFNRDMGELKGRMDLLPWTAIREVSKHCEEGAEKYGERNIDKGAPQWSLYSSCFRHLSKVIEPEEDDTESTLVHLRATCWNALWALEQYVNGKSEIVYEVDDDKGKDNCDTVNRPRRWRDRCSSFVHRHKVRRNRESNT